MSFANLINLVEVRPDRFRAPPAPERRGRMYGGQLLAQALAACQLTVTDDRDVHSLHAYFLRPGDIESAMELKVDRIRDGRSFSARFVRALQDGQELFRMMASFHVGEAGAPFAGHAMPDVTPPDDVTVTYNEFSREQGIDPAEWDGEARPMDIRYIDPPRAPLGEPVLGDQRMWMRISERLGEDWTCHFAGLAYLSDSTLIDHVVLPHGRRWQDPSLSTASLDHAMWFHHRARADEWLLFDQSVESTGDGRGLAVGRLFDFGGQLIATCVQEGMIRES